MRTSSRRGHEKFGEKEFVKGLLLGLFLFEKGGKG
jgi:hypothetical protein